MAAAAVAPHILNQRGMTATGFLAPMIYINAVPLRRDYYFK